MRRSGARQHLVRNSGVCARGEWSRQRTQSWGGTSSAGSKAAAILSALWGHCRALRRFRSKATTVATSCFPPCLPPPPPPCLSFSLSPAFCRFTPTPRIQLHWCLVMSSNDRMRSRLIYWSKLMFPSEVDKFHSTRVDDVESKYPSRWVEIFVSEWELTKTKWWHADERWLNWNTTLQQDVYRWSKRLLRWQNCMAMGRDEEIVVDREREEEEKERRERTINGCIAWAPPVSLTESPHQWRIKTWACGISQPSYWLIMTSQLSSITAAYDALRVVLLHVRKGNPVHGPYDATRGKARTRSHGRYGVRTRACVARQTVWYKETGTPDGLLVRRRIRSPSSPHRPFSLSRANPSLHIARSLALFTLSSLSSFLQ